MRNKKAYALFVGEHAFALVAVVKALFGFSESAHYVIVVVIAQVAPDQAYVVLAAERGGCNRKSHIRTFRLMRGIQ